MIIAACRAALASVDAGGNFFGVHNPRLPPKARCTADRTQRRWLTAGASHNCNAASTSARCSRPLMWPPANAGSGCSLIAHERPEWKRLAIKS